MEITIDDLSDYYKVKICYTVKGASYAVALVNSLKLNDLAENMYAVFACDDESKKVLDEHNINYISSYGLNVYNDKVLNAMKLSIARPNHIFIMMDIPKLFDGNMMIDWGWINKDLFENYKKQIFLFSYEFSTGDHIYTLRNENGNYYPQINAEMMCFHGVTEKQMKLYLDTFDTLHKDPNKYVRYYAEDEQRFGKYHSETPITEECVLQYLMCKNYEFWQGVTLDFDILPEGIDKRNLTSSLLARMTWFTSSDVFKYMVRGNTSAMREYIFLPNLFEEFKKYYCREYKV